MMTSEFKSERAELAVLNGRVDKTIKKISTVKIKDSVKGELLDIAREEKAQLANIMRLIDEF